jgi:tetratricopeptide (TPR) repeat protein
MKMKKMQMKNRQSQRHHRSVRTSAAKYLREAGDRFLLSGKGLVDKDADPAEDEANVRSALISAKRALLLDPSNYEAIVLIGNLYGDSDDARSTSLALEYFDRAIGLDPEAPDAYASKAELLLYDLNRPDEAEPLAQRALALSIRNEDTVTQLELTYQLLIEIFLAQKRFWKARAVIREALRRCPGTFMDAVAKNARKEIEAEKSGS